MFQRALLLVLAAALCQLPFSASFAEEAKPAAAAPAANPLPEVATPLSEWKPLIAPSGLAGWKKPTGDWRVDGEITLNPANEKTLTAKDGQGTLYNGPKGRTADIVSEADFGDIALHVEFMVPKGSNSGIYFMGRYEIQVYDSYGVAKDAYPGIECGGIYQRWDPSRGKGNEGFEGHSPRVNASKPPGEWQTFDILFRAPQFDAAGKKTANAKFVKVVHNGAVIHENIELTGPTRGASPEQEKAAGPLRLQGDHGPVAFRNLRIAKLPQ